MRSRTGGRAAAAFSPIKESPPAEKAAEWEVRPGGMLVQKRDAGADADAAAASVPTVRLKVKHGAVYHEIYISSQASFGEMKKMLSARTGLHPLDMKLVYKDKERESTAFLDTAGVKDKSKVVLEEDPTAQAKRLLEMRKTDKMEKAAKSISAISLEVDRLACKVSALEAIVNKGGRVVENDVTNLIDSLMNELVKLDAIVADGDVKLQRRMQTKRVQKYVETLDVIKIKNAMPRATNGELSKEQPQSPLQKNHQPQHPIQHQQQMQPKRVLQPPQHSIQSQYQQQKKDLQQPQHPIQPQHQQQMQQKRELQQPQNTRQQQNQQQQTHAQFQQQPVVVTTNWEMFDSLFMPSTSTASSAATTVTSTASSTPQARFDWELF